MKKKLFSPLLAMVAGVALSFLLCSFAFVAGGDSYTISVNGKQEVKHYVYSGNPLPSLALNVSSKDEISIYYSECGKIGVARVLSLRDDKGTVLREWKFKDSTNEHVPMSITASELDAKGQSLFLCYSSKEVTKPQNLAKLILSRSATASR